MTSIQPVNILTVINSEDPIGKEKRADIPNKVPPNPDGNNSLPPRTNLTGPLAAFQDDLTASGGGPIIIPVDHHMIGMPTPRWILIQDWMSRNSTPLVMIGIVVFIVMSVR